MASILAIGSLGNFELLVICVLFSPFVAALGAVVYYVRKAQVKKRPPPLPEQPPHP